MPEEPKTETTPGTLEDLAKRILGETCACWSWAEDDAPREENVRQVVALLEEAEHRPPPVVRVYVDGVVMVHGKLVSVRDLEGLIPKENMS